MTVSASLPLASLSLDLDNQWSYMKTHGDSGWEAYPTYLDTVVPRALDFLGERGLQITFFIVGLDADRDENHAALASIAAAGHEIGNHSYRHEPWLHLYSESELDDELAKTEAALERATGQHPVGFRGPGYSLSEPTLRVLRRRGYRYDASTLPTVIGPLARAYYFRSAKLNADQRAERAGLFGSFRDGLRPLRPYQWNVDGGAITELPVTTMPVVRLPVHVSYLIYLAGVSPAVARAYFRAALRLCRLRGIEPSLLLHPLDFLGPEDTATLGFFPGMGTTARAKRAVVAMAVEELSREHRIVTIGEHVADIERRRYLPRVPAAASNPTPRRPQ